MSKLFFYIGCARSGKNTHLRKWLLEREEDEIRIPVEADLIRLAMGARYNGYVEGLVHEFKKLTIRSYLQIPNAWVIVNGTHTNAHSIKDILSIDNDAQPIYVHATKEQCYRRAEQTNQEDLFPVINRMFSNLNNTWKKYYTMTEHQGMIEMPERPFKPLSEATQEDWEYIVDRIREEGIPKHTNRIVTV